MRRLSSFGPCFVAATLSLACGAGLPACGSDAAAIAIPDASLDGDADGSATSSGGPGSSGGPSSSGGLDNDSGTTTDDGGGDSGTTNDDGGADSGSNDDGGSDGGGSSDDGGSNGDAGALPTVTIDDVSANEGNAGTTSATFTVSLSAPSTETVTVAFATTDGTATAGTDYVATSGTLTFAPGITSQSVTVTINGDSTAESNETFVLGLSSPTNATLAAAQGIGTILDDDTASATPTFSIDNVTITEGNAGTANAIFTVTLANAGGSTVTVDYASQDGTATAGSDYTAVNGTLTFPPGTLTQTISVPIAGDLAVESDETYFVNLSNPSAGADISDAQGLGTITNDDVGAPPPPVPSIVINDARVLEGNAGSSNATFLVTLSAASAQTITVGYATANGTATAGSDYTATSGTVSFAPGVTSQFVTVAIGGDTVHEPNETFYVNLSAPTNATIADGQAAGTIMNDDGVPALSINDVTVTEGNSGTVDAVFTVTLASASSDTVTVTYTTTDGTATSASGDYAFASGTLTFDPGVTTQTIPIQVNGDLLNESNETFELTLSTPSNATIADGQGIGTISNDDAQPTLSINDLSVAEGNSGTTAMTFTVSLSTASGRDVAVGYATSGGTATAGVDYTAKSGTLFFPAGTLSQTVTVLVNGDATPESDETFFVDLAAPANATIADGHGVGTILNDDSALPTLSIADVKGAEGNVGVKVFSFTATLSAASTETVTVGYATADGTATAGSDYTANTGTLTFAPGVTSMKLNVLVDGDTTDEGDETFFVNLSGATNATISDPQALGTIQNDDAPPSVTITDVSKAEGNSGNTLFTFTVTLSAPSGMPVNATYSTADGTALAGSDYVATSGTLNFPSGITSRTITVRVNGDKVVEPNETFFVNLTQVTGATVAKSKATGTIVNDD